MIDAMVLRRELRVRCRCRDSLKKIQRAPSLIALPARLALLSSRALTERKGSTSSRHRDIRRAGDPSCPSTRLRARLGRGWARARRCFQVVVAEIPGELLRARVLFFQRMRQRRQAPMEAPARAGTWRVKVGGHLLAPRLSQ